MAGSRTKRKMSILTLRERISVIKKSEEGKSQRELAKEFKCSKTQIQATLACKQQFLKQWEENANENGKRRRWQPYEEVNKAVLEWFHQVRSQNFPLSGPMLQEKALQFASQLGIQDFHASNGWLNKFRMRHNIIFRTICGESAEVRQDDVQAWKERLCTITAGYADRDIYNMDETGLFFKAIPDRTLTVKGDQCKGGKLAKQRLTIALCANLCGEKEKPLVIHTAVRPRCFQRIDLSTLGVFWFANRKAWMTSEIFRSWIVKLNEKMRLQHRKILLFVDNAPCHCKENLTHVELKFFPANTTSCLQPMDQGVIRAFKIYYRKKLMRSMLAKMDEVTSVHMLAKGINVSDALSWVKSAWSDVKPETITKCFLKSGFLSTAAVDVPISDTGDAADSLLHLNHLGLAANVTIDMENIDEDIECFNTGENWEHVSIADSDSDPDDSEVNDGVPFVPIVQPITLKDALFSIRQHKLLAAELGSQLLIESLAQVEREYENVIVAKHLQNMKQTTISSYFPVTNTV